MLWEMIQETWGKPQMIICDRFRMPELQDAIKTPAKDRTKGNEVVRAIL